MTETSEEKNDSVAPIAAQTKGPAAARPSQSGHKQSANRMANKMQKKRAHKRNLRRSHTNG